MVDGRPSGTVSFLFTDVEGSTRLWDEHPAAMREALARHDEILRSAIEDRGGYVFSTAGDAFSAAFTRAGDAAGAAVAAQLALWGEPWPVDAQLRVRMGVHTGEAHERDGDYFGAAVNRAARLMALGHGGQVLLSSAVVELARDDLPDAVGLLSLGEHELRGLSRPESVFQLTGVGPSDSFPPLRSGVEQRGNLPTSVTSFVGRADDLKELGATVSDTGTRLVTLTGPGGVGKTRLAIETGWHVVDEFSDGAWMVELAPVADPESVVAAVADALDVRPQQDTSMTEAIVDRLRGQQALVIVDNCEHVLAVVAGLVNEIVHASSTVTLLATSREPLGVSGERVWSVRSLDAALEGAELFGERATAADRAFDLDEHRFAVEQLCEQLDGIPLAIELAAARVRSLSPEVMIDRIDDRFRLLRAGRHGVGHERHRTLRATVDWSYRLLDDLERTLFDRLSVFAGSFDLGAAEAVCADDEVIDELDVLDVLGSLVDKSLAVPTRTTGSDRYLLLETLRQYGEEQLSERGELTDLRDRHLDHYGRLATRAREQFEGTENSIGRAVFDTEWANLRAALDWAVKGGDAQAASMLVDDSYNYAMMTARREHGEWASRVRQLDGASAAVWGAAAWWALQDGQPDRAVQIGQEGLRRAPDTLHPDTFRCWYSLCAVHIFTFRGPESREAAENWVLTAKRRGEFELAMALVHQGLARSRRDPAAAAELAAEARRISRPLENPSLDCCLGFVEGLIEFGAGRYEVSAAMQADVVRRADESGSRVHAAFAADALAMCAVEIGTASPELWLDTLLRNRALQHWGYQWAVLEAVALSWIAEDRLEPAGEVLGHMEAHGEGFASLATRRREALPLLESDPLVVAAMERGAAMHRDEIVDYVIAELERVLA